MPRFETLLEEEGLFYVMTWEPELQYVSQQRRADLRARSRRQGQSFRLEQLVPFEPQHPGRDRVRARPGRRDPAAAARSCRPWRSTSSRSATSSRAGAPAPGVEAERLAVHRCAGFPGAGPPGGRHAARSREHRGRPGGRLRRRGDPRAQPRLRGGRRDQPEDRPRARPAQLGPLEDRVQPVPPRGPVLHHRDGLRRHRVLRAAAGGRRHRLPARLDGRRVRAGGLDRDRLRLCAGGAGRRAQLQG